MDVMMRHHPIMARVREKESENGRTGPDRTGQGAGSGSFVCGHAWNGTGSDFKGKRKLGRIDTCMDTRMDNGKARLDCLPHVYMCSVVRCV